MYKNRTRKKRKERKKTMTESRGRAPEFDRKDGSYARFMIKWQAFAQISGFSGALVPSYTVVLPATQQSWV